MEQLRKQKGTPAGGEFRAHNRDESRGNLGGDAWPEFAVEELPWDRDETLYEYLRASERKRILPTYLAAISPEISGRSPNISSETQATVEQATIELRNFSAEFGEDSAPFSAILLRTESVASSNIENLAAGAKAIATAELGGKTGENARLIVSNVEAMKAAIELSQTIDERTILRMHEVLLKGTRPEIAGRWREEQVWIGGSPVSPHGAAYIAPHHSRVPAAIADLMLFAGRDDLPAFVKTAITHAHFENIHPFPDGNGRTGRALMSAMIRHEGLVDQVTVPISSGLLAHSDEYFQALNAYRDGDTNRVVEMTAHSTVFAVGNSRALVKDIRSLRQKWMTQVGGRRGSATAALTQMLAGQPVVTADTVAKTTGVSIAAAYRAVQEHVTAGVLIPGGKIRGAQSWSAPELLGALEAFAARADRRG
jgi:Fic family protein